MPYYFMIPMLLLFLMIIYNKRYIKFLEERIDQLEEKYVRIKRL